MANSEKKIQLTQKQAIVICSFIALSLIPSVYLYTSKIIGFGNSLNTNQAKVKSIKKDVTGLRKEVYEMKKEIIKELKVLNYEMGRINGELKRIK